MLKVILLALAIIQLVNCVSISKRETCNPAIDLTRVDGTCNQFHRCFNGYYAVVTCSTGYEFDPTAKTCRLDAEVNCVSRGNECGVETDYAKVQNDCRKYFRCINGYLSVETCAEGYVFNSATKSCDWPSNVAGCEHYYWGNECDVSIDLTRTSNDCTKFNRCDRGWLRVETCPDGLVFDNNAKVCNWPAQVPGCERTFWGNECESNIDYTRVTNDCTKFYLCDKGWLKTQSCQDGLVFDNNAKVCNWPEQVPGCERTFWGNECEPSIDLTRVSDQCNKYYRCSNGYLKVETCPNGLSFDNNLKRCEWSNTVNCGSTCLSSQDLTQVANDCSRFYKCINGVLTTETCPSGYLFDANIKACNVAFMVNSCNSINNVPAQTNIACTAASDLTQVPGNCNSYYRCVNGVLTTESCPNGMNFDRTFRACNVANQVLTCF